MKAFCNSKLLKPELRKEMCTFAAAKGVAKVAFNEKAKRVSGTYNARKQVIFINNNLDKKQMLCTFFHELAHHTAVKKRKWLVYHFNPSSPLLLVSEKFKIENKIDKIAKELWNKYVDTKEWGRYKYAYPKTEKREIIKWLTQYF